MVSTDDILKKYGSRIERQMNGFSSSKSSEKFSKSYNKFKEDMSPEFSRYEKWCKSMGVYLK